jgi:hypothetical protein
LRAYKIRKFRGVVKVIKYQQEFVSQVEEEIKPLIAAHWEEVEVYQNEIKLNPCWESYYGLELQGNLKVFTARSEERLVGYFVAVVSPNIHHKTHLFALCDIVYLHKDYRKGLTGVKLIKFAEGCLRLDGVSVLVISSKVQSPLRRILTWLKFKPSECSYSKYLGDK